MDNMSVAKLPRIVLQGQRIVGADFGHRRLGQFSSAGCHFESCTFDRIRCESAAFGAGMTMSTYTDCTFDGAQLRPVPGGYYRFERCTFHGATIRDWLCFAVEVVDCTFDGTRITKAIFNGTPMREDAGPLGRSANAFDGNDFSRAILRDVGFRSGIDLARQQLPLAGDFLYGSDAAAALAHAHLEVIGWSQLAERQLALDYLGALRRLIAAGQQQLYLREADFPTDRVTARVFQLLREAALSSSPRSFRPA